MPWALPTPARPQGSILVCQSKRLKARELDFVGLGLPTQHSTSAPKCLYYVRLYMSSAYSPLREAITKYHTPGDLNNSHNLLSHDSGGHKSEMKVSAELMPFESYEGRIHSRSLFLTCEWIASPSGSVSKFPLFIKIPIVLDQGPHQWLPQQRHYLQIRWQPEIKGLRTFTVHFRGTQFNP